jgi:hypothetical protein
VYSVVVTGLELADLGIVEQVGAATGREETSRDRHRGKLVCLKALCFLVGGSLIVQTEQGHADVPAGDREQVTNLMCRPPQAKSIARARVARGERHVPLIESADVAEGEGLHGRPGVTKLLD